MSLVKAYIMQDLHLLTHWGCKRMECEIYRGEGIAFTQLRCSCGKVFYNDLLKNVKKYFG